MPDWLIPYQPSLFALLATAGLMLGQLLVLDFSMIKAKQPPGIPIAADADRFLFRANRALSNTNESIAVFILLMVTAIFAAASPIWINISAWVYVAARFGHMLCYYADLRLARSAHFALSLLALGSLFVASLMALI